MRLLRLLFPLLLAVLFLADVARFYSGRTGFTSFLQVGDKLGASRGLRGVPHHVYVDSWGYDGQAYAQLALHPTLADPVLRESVDNLSYRARRIGVPWLAWLAGLGQPRWVLQAYSLVNVAAWLAIGWLLLHWLPPERWSNLARWACLMFCVGLLNSVRCALVDAPALALLLLGLRLQEAGRPATSLGALAGCILSRDTMVAGVAAALYPPGLRGVRGQAAWLGRLALCVAPIGLWVLFVWWRTEASPLQGGSNFTWPLLGWYGRWRELFQAVLAPGPCPEHVVFAVLAHFALSLQLLFFVFHRRPESVWWRLGLSSCVLLAFLGPAVWEGYPGAAARVLLPMTFAFNLLLPRGRRWLLLFLLGNLGVLAGWRELASPPLEELRWRGLSSWVEQVDARLGEGWHPPERGRLETWVWSREQSVLHVVNHGPGVLRVRLSGRFSVPMPQRVSIVSSAGESWSSGPLEGKHRPFETREFTLPVGRLELRFEGETPGVEGLNGDPRRRAFSVRDLTLEIVAPPGSSP